MSESMPLLHQPSQRDCDTSDAEVAKLEQDMILVNEIFRDMSVMITSQGEMLNTIEGNITYADTDVEAGTQHVQKAAKYQKSSRGYMCVLLLVLIILAVIGIIVGTQIHKRK
jgi:t-SNARE complex subunit (syntaxin)